MLDWGLLLSGGLGEQPLGVVQVVRTRRRARTGMPPPMPSAFFFLGSGTPNGTTSNDSPLNEKTTG